VIRLLELLRLVRIARVVILSIRKSQPDYLEQVCTWPEQPDHPFINNSPLKTVIIT
jgi:hypothetical protein